MTVVQPAGTGAELADGALLANVRPARAAQRGAAARGLAGPGTAKPVTVAPGAQPFEAQLLVAARDLPDPGNPQDERRPAPKDADDEPADATSPETPVLAVAVVIEQRLPLVPADGAPAAAAGAGAGVGAGIAMRTASAREAALESRRSAGTDSLATAESGATLPMGFEQLLPTAGAQPAAPDAGSAPVGPALSGDGPEMPITAPTAGPDRAQTGSSPAGRSAESAARRGGAVAIAPTPGFRLEPAGPSGAGVPDVRAATVPEQGPAQLPADILVAGTGGEAAGLDVTIAAATPDLRDRFRAATDELLADLSAIGTEVDAIHVELRGELADGGSGASAGEDGGARGDIDGFGAGDGVQTGWRELDAAARIDMSDGGRADAAQAAEPEAAAEPDGQAAQDASRDMAGGGRDRQPGRGAGFDLERLRLVPQAPLARSAAVAGAGTANGTPNTRIDRYA